LVGGVDHQLSAHLGSAVRHAGQPMACAFARFGLARFDTPSIVAYFKHDLAVADMGFQTDGVGTGMFDDVRSGFLQQAQQLQAVTVALQKIRRQSF
jgi:hypothetical protein